MTLRACHAVPVLALFALSGCYLFHGVSGDPPRRDGGRPIPGDDGGRPPPPPPPPPPVDAGPVPSSCFPTAADFACTTTETGFVPVGVAYDLPVYFGDGQRCWCGEQLRCTASLGFDGALELSTHECAELLCDGCFMTVEGSCRLPPLPAGRYPVRMNGNTVFDLEVSDATPGVGPVDHCLTHPRDPTLACGWVWGPMAEPTDQICHPGEAVAGEPIFVAITDFCLGCGKLVGPCRVTRTASSIEVHPSSLFSQCDVDCPVECGLAESTCVIPPLEPGEYTVTLAGLPGSTALLVLDPGGIPRPGNACNSIPEG